LQLSTIKAESSNTQEFTQEQYDCQSFVIDKAQGQVLKNSIRGDIKSLLRNIEISSSASSISFDKSRNYSSEWAEKKLAVINIKVR